MKKNVLTAADATFYMTGALGVISLLNLIFVNYSNVPTIFIVIGLSLGIISWWKKPKVIEEMHVFADLKYLKLYVYLYQLFLYVFAFCGFLELFCLYFGLSSIEAYQSFTRSYAFSWKSVFTAVIIILSWQTSARNLHEHIVNNIQKVYSV